MIEETVKRPLTPIRHAETRPGLVHPKLHRFAHSTTVSVSTWTDAFPGRTRFDRLIFIGRTCVPLCVEALKAAVAEAKSGQDVKRYREAWEMIRLASPSESEALLDQDWLEKTTKANQTQTQHLENQVKLYKANLIKESIRVCC